MVLVVISIVWIPVLRASEGSELFVYIQEVSSFMQPPICCVYLLSILWDRLNELVITVVEFCIYFKDLDAMFISSVS